jgi:hypothetical protein
MARDIRLLVSLHLSVAPHYLAGKHTDNDDMKKAGALRIAACHYQVHFWWGGRGADDKASGLLGNFSVSVYFHALFCRFSVLSLFYLSFILSQVLCLVQSIFSQSCQSHRSRVSQPHSPEEVLD